MKRLTFLIIVLNAAISLILLNPKAEAERALESEVLKLSLDGVIDMALASSEDFKIKTEQINKAKGIYAQARSKALPNISAESQWIRNTSYPNIESKYGYELSGGVAISQILWAFGRVSNAVDSAKRSVEASRFNREASKQDIIYAAKLSYYSSLLAKNTLAITESSYKNLLESKELLESRSYGGRSSSYEIIRMDAELAGRVPALNESKVNLASALESLKRLIGLDSDYKLDLKDDFKRDYAGLDYNSLLALFYERQPTLKSLDQALKSAEANLKSEKAGYLPALSFLSGWNYLGASDKSSFLANHDKDQHYTFIGLKFDIPIWEGGQTQAKVDQARAQREIAALEKEQAERDALLELKKSFLDYKQYRENLKANIKAVEAAEEAFKYTQRIFSSGKAGISALNDAEALLTAQRINREITLFNINLSLARIETLVAAGYDLEIIDEEQ
jgi:outer membrane protein